MDLDIFLANNCKSEEGFLRLYRWDPYAISLGANQSFDDVDIDPFDPQPWAARFGTEEERAARVFGRRICPFSFVEHFFRFLQQLWNVRQ